MPELEFNEEEVLTRASEGDRDAFGLLYERYIDRIFNYVYYRTGNLHDAEDLTARVFQRAMNHIQNYTDRGVPFLPGCIGLPTTWSPTGTVTEADGRKSRSTMCPCSLRRAITPKGIWSGHRNRIRCSDSSAACHRRTTNLLILKFVENMSNAEIGAIMGRSEGAVKSLISSYPSGSP